MYAFTGFRMSSSAGDALSILIISEISALFCPPARVIVRYVCGLDIPGCFADLLYRRHLLKPVSDLASKSLKFC